MDNNYWIRGSKQNADKIKRTFGSVGISAKNVLHVSFEDENNLYVYDGMLKLFNIIPYESAVAMAVRDSHHFDELQLPVEPVFKVGDRLKRKNDGTIWAIAAVSKRKDFYYLTSDLLLDVALFTELDEYELVEPKPKFAVGDIIVSRENQEIKYKILEAGIPNKARGHDYRLELLSTEFKGAKRYISVEKVDSWGELVASTE